jgi:hypothetical protein
MGTIHAGRIETSKRLQLVHQALLDGPKTSLELQRLTGGCAIHSDVAELRAQGIQVEPAKYWGRTDEGRKVYCYQLAREVLA